MALYTAEILKLISIPIYLFSSTYINPEREENNKPYRAVEGSNTQKIPGEWDPAPQLFRQLVSSFIFFDIKEKLTSAGP